MQGVYSSFNTQNPRKPRWVTNEADCSTLSQRVPIPTEDAEAALRFCQTLADLLDQKGSGQESDLSLASNLDRHGSFQQPDLSVVIPVFNEAGNLPALHTRLRQALETVHLEYEIIFVNDGSTDGSTAILENIAQDSHVTILDLARNFGHQVAISAGLDFARGQGVIVMDADLQDPPEILPQFISGWQAGHDVVYAIREQRQEHWLLRAAYAAFYRLWKRIANINIPLDAGDFCIMDRRVVDLLVRMPERNRFLRGIRSWVGLSQVGIPYNRQARLAGESKYTLTRLLYLALDGLVSFSFVPLRLISIIGISVSLVSLLLAAIYTIQKLTSGLNPAGFATTVVAIFFLAGIQLITIGVIGEYVGRIFEEVKRRPLYIVREVVRRHAG